MNARGKDTPRGDEYVIDGGHVAAVSYFSSMTLVKVCCLSERNSAK
jgi:hypothetical protein